MTIAHIISLSVFAIIGLAALYAIFQTAKPMIDSTLKAFKVNQLTPALDAFHIFHKKHTGHFSN